MRIFIDGLIKEMNEEGTRLSSHEIRIYIYMGIQYYLIWRDVVSKKYVKNQPNVRIFFISTLDA